MSHAIFPSESQHSSRPEPPLPVRHQDELIRGTKYAVLMMDEDGRPCFNGTGGHGHGRYYAEDTAKCHAEHAAPDEDCGCGFWVPVRKESALAQWNADWVQLEVEIGGRILGCGRNPLPAPAWGYRAQWQRVLSVTLSPKCGMAQSWNKDCAGPARWLCAAGRSSYHPGCRKLISACIVHMRRSDYVIATPVSWLRRELRTEVRPGSVSDELPREDRERLGAIDAVARQQYPVGDILKAVTMPPNPQHGDLFRVCVDVTSKMTYEFAWIAQCWQVNAIYHPMLEPWGWGTPDA